MLRKKRILNVLFSGAAAARNSVITSSCRLALCDIRRRQMEDQPLFAVVGCTGTGKTKLGVRLAKELNGEVVSADSIQVIHSFRSLTVSCHGTGRRKGRWVGGPTFRRRTSNPDRIDRSRFRC